MCLRNFKICFDGVILSINSHLVKMLELSKLRRKKSYGALKILKMACQKEVSGSKKRHIFYFCFYIIWLTKYLHFILNELIK